MFKGIYTTYHLIISISAWLVLGSSTTVIFILATSRLANASVSIDPFAKYADIRPGQPVSVLEPYDCLIVYYFPGYSRDACEFSPNDGVFSRVLVRKAGEQIQVVTFYVRNMRLVDLVYRWGKPSQVIRDTYHYNAIWDQGITAYTTTNQRRFSYLLPIQLVTLSSPISASK